MKTTVPFDVDYVKLVGTAVYLFSYYEWRIIYIIEQLERGFVAEYSRGKPMTSGTVQARFERALDQDAGGHDVDTTALRSCCQEFAGLRQERNALIHAHPITDSDGAQILNYQSELSKPISDKTWKDGDVENFIEQVDAAACRAGKLMPQFN